MGLAYATTEHLSEAIRTLESALRGRTQALGPAHRDTLDTQHMLAVAMANDRETGRAIQILEAAASQCAAAYGAEDPNTVRIRADLDELRRRSNSADVPTTVHKSP